MLYAFDCDGVLIDSEIIAAEVDAEHFTAAGYEITAEEIMKRFSGMTVKDIIRAVEEEMGHKLPEDFFEEQKAELDRRLAEELDAIEGIHEMLDELDRLGGPKCVCSNSSGARLEMTLGATQLYTRFAPNVFSAVEVGTKQPKPDPNVYSFAAAHFGVETSQMVVLEDSVFGVMAARAAGARVIGFTGAGHSWPSHADELTEAGAETVIKRLVDYPATATALAGWREDAF